MITSRMPLPLFLLAFVVAGCAKKETASADSSAPPAVATTPAASSASAGDLGTTEDVSNYTLDMDKMHKWANTMKGFVAAAQKDPAAADALKIGANEPMATTIARLEADPTASRVLRESGMSARDYVATMAAYLQAEMMSAVLKSKPDAAVPAGQNPKNIEFVRTHEAELLQLQKDAGLSDK